MRLRGPGLIDLKTDLLMNPLRIGARCKAGVAVTVDVEPTQQCRAECIDLTIDIGGHIDHRIRKALHDTACPKCWVQQPRTSKPGEVPGRKYLTVVPGPRGAVTTANYNPGGVVEHDSLHVANKK